MLKDETEVLTAPVRRARMLRAITDREFVRVADLAEAFGISDVTVRADLASLERSDGVRRVRGGVMAPVKDLTRTERSFEEQVVEHAGEKRAIAEYVAAQITPGMSVLLDVGTTTAAVARALIARTELEQITVITNGLNIALELEAAVGRFAVVVTGGTLRRLQHSLVHPLGRILLDQLHADVAVIGCNGVDVEHGVTNINLPEAEIKKAMVAAADRTLVVADGSKIGRVHLGRIAAVGDVDTVVTGASASAHDLTRLRRAGVDVIPTG